jgi:hypothetical protein
VRMTLKLLILVIVFTPIIRSHHRMLIYVI